MLTAAAVCPHPPLLVPAATGGGHGPGDDELAVLREACHAVAAALTGALTAGQADLLVVVGGDQRTTRYAAQSAGSLAAYGIPVSTGDGPPVLPLSLTIARWLLGPGEAIWQGIASDASPETCLLLGARLAALAPRVAILAMGDGPARRARRAPGAIDADADRYDKQVVDALTTADASTLAELDPRLDDELFIAGRPAWQVLAGAVLASSVPAGPGDGRFAARLRYAGAPFEVSFYVASWTLR
jgi:hypothetical protein